MGKLSAFFFRNFLSQVDFFYLMGLVFVIAFMIRARFDASPKLFFLVTNVIITYTYQRTIIHRFIEDKIFTFKGIFRIMGVGNLEYLFCQLTCSLCFISLTIVIGYVITALMEFTIKSSQLQCLAISILSSIAMISFALFSSLFFRNPEVAVDISNVFSFFVNFIAIFSTVTQSPYIAFLKFLPNTIYFDLLQKIYYADDTLPLTDIWLDLVLLGLLTALYLSLYQFLDKLLRDDNGMNKTLWSALFDKKNQVQNNERLPANDPELIAELIRASKDISSVFQIEEVDLKLKAGDLLCILGPNGAGKSTILRILVGLNSLSSGKVFHNGKEVSVDDPSDSVGYCPPNNLLMQNLTIEQHLKFYCLLKGVDKERTIDDLLSKFGLKKYRKGIPSDLSGGNQRKLCIAIASIGSPKLLVLDEPTSSLDPHSKKEILTVLKDLRDEGKTAIVLSSHDLDEVQLFPSKVMLLSKGKSIINSSLSEIKQKFQILTEVKAIPRANSTIEPEFVGNIQTMLSVFKDIKVTLNMNDISVWLPESCKPDLTQICSLIMKATGNTLDLEINSNAIINIFSNIELMNSTSFSETEEAKIESFTELLNESQTSTAFERIKVLFRFKFRFILSNSVQLITLVVVFSFILISQIYAVHLMQEFLPDISLKLFVIAMCSTFFLNEGYGNFTYCYLIVYEKTLSLTKIFISNGVKLTEYYLSRYLADLFLSTVIYIPILIATYFTVMKSIEPGLIAPSSLILLLCAIFFWKSAFILNSYLIAHIFNRTNAVMKNFFVIYFLVSLVCYGLSKFVPLLCLFNDFAYLSFVFDRFDSIHEIAIWIFVIPIFHHVFFLGVLIYKDYLMITHNYRNPKESLEDSVNESARVGMSARSTRFYQRYAGSALDDCLEVKKLTKIYPNDRVSLNNVSLTLNRGDSMGLIGANGAGKSTFFNILVGEVEKTQGQILFNHKFEDVPFYTKNIGICLQKDSLYSELTVREHFELISALQGHRDTKKVDAIISIFSLTQYLDLQVFQLNDGTRRKVCIGLALLRKPDYLFFDEATSGIDVFTCQVVQKMLKAIEYKFGSIIIISTHMMREVEFLCDRLAVLYDGEIVISGPVYSIKKSRSEKKIKLLMDQKHLDEFFSEVKKFQNCWIDPHTLNDMYKVIILKKGEENPEIIQKLLQVIARFQEQKLIEDFELSSSTLDELFIEIMREYQPVLKDRATENSDS